MRAAIITPCLLLAACVPDVDVDESLVSSVRLLAIAASPADATPGTRTTFTALVGGPDGTVRGAPIDWAYCTARRSLAELGPVSGACFAAEGEDLTVIGSGDEVQASLPREGCRRFGPEVPPPEPGEPAGRPVEADPSGGYFQPVRVIGPEEPPRITLFETRIACGLASAAPADAREYRLRYRSNTRPEVSALEVIGEDRVPIDPVDGVVFVPRGARLGTYAEWPACPEVAACGDGVCSPEELQTECPADCTRPVGCGGAERYLAYDAIARSLVTRRESMRVAWYATGGAFDRARTGRSADDLERSTESTWTAPDEPGDVVLWAVVRDERGGVAWSELAIRVE